MPSLQAPRGRLLTPVMNEPSGVKSVAFHTDALSPLKFVTRMRCPSKAAARGVLRSLPVRVASTKGWASGLPAESFTRTTVTEAELELGTQMFVPSKIG